MTPIAAMVAKMLAAGTPHEAIVLAVETAEQVMDVRGHSADVSADIPAERRRAADRERKRLARLSAENLRKSADSAECPMSASTVSLSKKEPSKRENSRGRGTRLPPDWTPTQADLNFAVSHQWPDALIDTEAIKFRNYWTSKTGRDATKLDWGRTWQNWVLNARGPRNGHVQTASPLIAAADRLVEVTRERAERSRRESGIFDRAGPAPPGPIPPGRGE